MKKDDALTGRSAPAPWWNGHCFHCRSALGEDFADCPRRIYDERTNRSSACGVTVHRNCMRPHFEQYHGTTDIPDGFAHLWARQPEAAPASATTLEAMEEPAQAPDELAQLVQSWHEEADVAADWFTDQHM